MSALSLLNPLNAVKLLNPFFVGREIVSGVKTAGAAFNLYDANKLKDYERATAKTIGTTTTKVLTPVVKVTGTLSPFAGATAGFISGGFAGGVAGLAAGTTAAGLALGVTKYPTATEKTLSTAQAAAKNYANLFTNYPLETSLLTGGGLLAGLFGAKATGAAINYAASRAGTAAALDNLGYSNGAGLPPINNNNPTNNRRETTTTPTDITNPTPTTIDNNPVPLDSKTPTSTRRRAYKPRQKDINIRNTVNVYNALRV